jgi:hypothetical protein
MDSHYPTRNIPIRSISLNLSDVQKVFERLLLIVSREGDEQIGALVRPDELTDEQWSLRKAEIKSKAFRVTITIRGRNGDELFGDAATMFVSPNIPHAVSAVYMTNSTAYRGWTGQQPLRLFELNFDFSKPSLLDSERIVSSPTPNQSFVRIQSDNDAWLASVNEAVFGVIEHKKVKRKFLHRAFVYDLGLMVLALPAAFYIAGIFSGTVTNIFGSANGFLVSAFYVYLILAVMWAYRIFFGYTKWIFPSVELKESSSSTLVHRVFWVAILVGVIGNFATDALKYLWH